MVAGSQEEGSGMAEIVTSVLGGAERAAARAMAAGRVAGRWQVERSVGIYDGEGMEEVRERDRRKWRCGLPLRS